MDSKPAKTGIRTRGHFQDQVRGGRWALAGGWRQRGGLGAGRPADAADGAGAGGGDGGEGRARWAGGAARGAASRGHTGMFGNRRLGKATFRG